MRRQRTYVRGLGLTAAGAVLISPDSLLIRLIQADDWTLLFWRGVFMWGVLLVGVGVKNGRDTMKRYIEMGLAGLFCACMFAAGTILFVLSIRLTAVANTLVIIALAPVLAALFSHFFIGEGVPVRTWFAALAGAAALTGVFAGSIRAGGLAGDLCAAGTALLLAGNFVLIRKKRKVSMVPALTMSGALVAATMLLVTDPFGVSGRDLGLLFLLGGVVLPSSLGLITIGPRYLPAPEVGLLMLLETVLGPLWVWLACAEIPHAGTFVGGSIVVGILVGHSMLGMRKPPTDTSMIVPPGMSP